MEAPTQNLPLKLTRLQSVNMLQRVEIEVQKSPLKLTCLQSVNMLQRVEIEVQKSPLKLTRLQSVSMLQRVEIEVQKSVAFVASHRPLIATLASSRSRSRPGLAGMRQPFPRAPDAPGSCIHLRDPLELDPSVSKLIAHTRREQRRALRQSTYTNRYSGDPRLEGAYQQYTTQLQLRKVRRRLFICGTALVYESAYVLFAPKSRSTSMQLKCVHGLLPCAIVLGAGAALYAPVAQRSWRVIVIVVSLVTFNMVVFTMLPLAASEDGRSDVLDVDELLLSQLVWLLLFQIVITLNSALDFALVAGTCGALYACFIVLLATQCAPRMSVTSKLHVGMEIECHPERVAKAIGLATVAMVLLLFGARRINRFDRLSFVRSYFQQERLDEDAGMIAGERIELLGIFSNPTLTARQQQQLRLQPLRLGQELKFLMRAVPRVHLEVLPAATFDDARASVLRYNPRILMFSGHTFAQTVGVSALAFEQDNSRMDLHSSPAQFVAMLAEACAAPACKLTCVFLNACLTLPLALEVLRQLPQLQLICWATIAEDSAARYFSSGFADSIGEALEQADGTRSATDRGPDVRRAFQRGCEVFRSVGCNFGDPQPYLDAGETMPPVQGDVLLLSTCATSGAILAWRLNDHNELDGEVLEGGAAAKKDVENARASLAADGRSGAEQAVAPFELGGSERDSTPSGAERPVRTVSFAGCAAQSAALVSLKPSKTTSPQRSTRASHDSRLTSSAAAAEAMV